MSLATEDQLTAATWSDFVKRLHHHCKGEGVHAHYTASAIFTVQARRIIYGIDQGYTDKLVVIFEDSEWLSPQEYWDDADEEIRAALDLESQEGGDCDFLELGQPDQWGILGGLEDHMVTGWLEDWEHINSHFTREAADAFIARKKHDYRKGLRVYVDAQSYCWEFEVIKEGILNGQIGFIGKQEESSHDNQ